MNRQIDLRLLALPHPREPSFQCLSQKSERSEAVLHLAGISCIGRLDIL
jgi:hypothetical protein